MFSALTNPLPNPDREGCVGEIQLHRPRRSRTRLSADMRTTEPEPIGAYA